MQVALFRSFGGIWQKDHHHFHWSWMMQPSNFYGKPLLGHQKWSFLFLQNPLLICLILNVMSLTNTSQRIPLIRYAPLYIYSAEHSLFLRVSRTYSCKISLKINLKLFTSAAVRVTTVREWSKNLFWTAIMTMNIKVRIHLFQIIKVALVMHHAWSLFHNLQSIMSAINKINILIAFLAIHLLLF